ncbi:MAG TPA: ATP-binding protein [Acidimicrobiales bacterium]|nr:ATP-binding protein [Acidimicrobiales bacterium]
MPTFVGRVAELRSLHRLLERVRAGGDKPGQCVLIRGRRRVGKSRLAEVFVQRAAVPSCFFTASRQRSGELALFAEEVRGSGLSGAALFEGNEPTNWDAGLRLLAQALPDDSVSVVVIDEFPYLVEDDETVEATFQKQWDRNLSKKPVLLLLIGSNLAMMEALNTHRRAFFQRATEMAVPPLSPAETANIVGAADSGEAFDAALVTGGLPLICEEWPTGASMWDYLDEALSDPTSALIVSAERSLAAEFPSEVQARVVLEQIGSGERTFTNIARAAGGLHAASASRTLDLLTDKRVVARDVPLSTRPSREARYRVADPYLRFWLRFVGPHLAEIERGRGDRVVARIRSVWTTWRGRAIEPVVREALARLLPIGDIDGPVVGGYWTRTNTPEVDLVGADREPVAKKITFSGSIKWLDDQAFSTADLKTLARKTNEIPGAGPETPLVVVSRSGVTAKGAALSLGPEELLRAFSASASAS